MDIKNLHVIQIVANNDEYQYLKMKEISIRSFIVSTTPRLQNAAVFSSKTVADDIMEKLKTKITEINEMKNEQMDSIEGNRSIYPVHQSGPFGYYPSLPNPISMRMINQNIRLFSMENVDSKTGELKFMNYTIANRFIGQYSAASTISVCSLSDIVDKLAKPVV